LNPTTFLKLLIAEMQDQSPLAPMSSNALMTQVATLSEASDIQNLTQMDALIAQLSESQAAVSLLGRAVQASNASGPVQGTVAAVLAGSSGSPALVVNTASGPATVSLASVSAVAESASALPTSAGS
jgi:flagellar basal-body rod modification protein FlgD